MTKDPKRIDGSLRPARPPSMFETWQDFAVFAFFVAGIAVLVFALYLIIVAALTVWS